jgi:ferredoxin, 2Fe-2S
MINVIFTYKDRPDHKIEVTEGMSLMEAAKGANVEGIDADCGGCMVCGTCHVYVDAPWSEKLARPSDMEAQILECVPSPDPRARLSCQIAMNPSLDGLTVQLPEQQR